MQFDVVPLANAEQEIAWKEKWEETIREHEAEGHCPFESHQVVVAADLPPPTDEEIQAHRHMTIRAFFDSIGGGASFSDSDVEDVEHYDAPYNSGRKPSVH